MDLILHRFTCLCSLHEDYVAIKDSQLRNLLYQWGRGTRKGKELPELSKPQVKNLLQKLQKNKPLQQLCLHGILNM